MPLIEIPGEQFLQAASCSPGVGWICTFLAAGSPKSPGQVSGVGVPTEKIFCSCSIADLPLTIDLQSGHHLVEYAPHSPNVNINQLTDTSMLEVRSFITDKPYSKVKTNCRL